MNDPVQEQKITPAADQESKPSLYQQLVDRGFTKEAQALEAWYEANGRERAQRKSKRKAQRKARKKGRR